MYGGTAICKLIMTPATFWELMHLCAVTVFLTNNLQTKIICFRSSIIFSSKIREVRDYITITTSGDDGSPDTDDISTVERSRGEERTARLLERDKRTEQQSDGNQQ